MYIGTDIIGFVHEPTYRRGLGFLLAALGRRTDAAWSRFLRGVGLTNAEFAALAVLVQEAPSQGELAGYLGIDPRNAGALVRKLRERGWVDSVADAADGRRTILRCTDDGRAAWDELQATLPAARTNYFGTLTAAEQAELQRLLNKLNDGFLGRA